MSKTVKRALWQRTLETAGPLRKALPQAPSQELEAFFCRMQAIVDRGEERRRRQTKRTMLFGMDFAQGGVLDRTIVRLVGERGPELRLTIPAGGLKVGEPVNFDRCVEQFWAAMQQFVQEINEDPKK